MGKIRKAKSESKVSLNWKINKAEIRASKTNQEILNQAKDDITTAGQIEELIITDLKADDNPEEEFAITTQLTIP